jgi:maltose O-acetyltransferase
LAPTAAAAARCPGRRGAARPDADRLAALLEQLLGHRGEAAEIAPPFACDYGYDISTGDGALVDFNAVFLDCAPITVGDRAQIGPAVQLLAADHPRDAGTRRRGFECAKPVTIGADARIGAGAIVLPGVTVGEGAIVGAGSVVTRDVPPAAVVAGNPARILP